MNKRKRFKRICSAFLTALFVATPLFFVAPTGFVESAYAAEEGAGASIVFGTNMQTDRASVVISDTNDDKRTASDSSEYLNNHAILGTHEGRGCLITQNSIDDTKKYLSVPNYVPVLVDDSYISSTDQNIAVKITYFDYGWDTFQVWFYNQKGGKQHTSVAKYGTNTWRTATIILRNPCLNGQWPYGGDIVIGNEKTSEYISKIELVNLDKTYDNQFAGSKTDIFHMAEAKVLQSMGLFEGYNESEAKCGLDAHVTREKAAKAVVTLAYGGTQALANAKCFAWDVSEDMKPYVGLAVEKGIIKPRPDGTVGAKDYLTIRQLLEMFIMALNNTGYRFLGTKTVTEGLTTGLVTDVATTYKVNAYAVNYYYQKPGFYKEEMHEINRYAYGDDLAALSYNMLKQTISGYDTSVLKGLYERQQFNQNMIVTGGCGDLLNFYYDEVGYQLEEETYTDSSTGVTYKTIGLPGLSTCTAYPHAAGSSRDGKILVLLAAIDPINGEGAVVAYNRETKQTTTLNSEGRKTYTYGFVTSPDSNDVFYLCGRDIYRYNLGTGVDEKIATRPNDGSTGNRPYCGVPSVTNDGKHVTVYGGYTGGRPLNYHQFDYNEQTGAWDCTEVLTRAEVGNMTVSDAAGTQADASVTEKTGLVDYINHMQINPTDPNMHFYLRLNSSSGGLDKIWTVTTGIDSVTGEPVNTHKNLFKSQVRQTGQEGAYSNTQAESYSHETWSYNGERLYFIKYYNTTYTPEIPGHGMVYVNKDGNSDATIEGYINGDYQYNHMGVSSDEKLFVGDTSTVWDGERYVGKLVLVYKDEGNRSRLLLDDVGIWSEHPGHTHPNFSLDSSTIYFTVAAENNHLRAAYIDMNSLPAWDADTYYQKKVASVEFGEETVETGIYMHTEFPTRPKSVLNTMKATAPDGTVCRKIPAQNRLSLDVYPHYVSTQDNEVTVSVTYYTQGTLDLTYNSNIDTKGLPLTSPDSNHVPQNAKKPDAGTSVTKTDKNGWQTTTYTLRDVSFRNAGEVERDLDLRAGSKDVYIKSVKVCKGTSIPN